MRNEPWFAPYPSAIAARNANLAAGIFVGAVTVWIGSLILPFLLNEAVVYLGLFFLIFCGGIVLVGEQVSTTFSYFKQRLSVPKDSDDWHEEDEDFSEARKGHFFALGVLAGATVALFVILVAEGVSGWT